jgi:anti-sigma-K factor RskA
LESFMSDDINDRIDELLVLAALGELSEAENDGLDRALAADSELADELAADLAVAARLQSIAAIVPPAAVKQSVMAAIKSVAQDAGPAATNAGPASPTLVASPQVVPISSARSRRWQPLAAAAAVAILLVGGIVASTRDSGQNQFDAVAEASDAQRRPFVGKLDGTLDAVWSPSAQAFVLAGTDIPVLTDAETYQLWLIDAGGATPVGIFQPNDDGDVEQVFTDVDPSDFILGVTVEPAGGSDQPTLPVITAA